MTSDSHAGEHATPTATTTRSRPTATDGRKVTPTMLTPAQHHERRKMDFPTAWSIARQTPPENHHHQCSLNVTSGALLCDCVVLTGHPEYHTEHGRGSDTAVSKQSMQRTHIGGRP